MGWSEAVGERIKLVHMAANLHAMLLKPYVSELARLIKEHILSAEAVNGEKVARGRR